MSLLTSKLSDEDRKKAHELFGVHEQFDEVAGRSAARQTNYTAGVTWQPFKHLRCQLNYTYEQYGGTNPDRNVVKAMLTGIF